MYKISTIVPRSLYIHWPFCPYKCDFCPFVAIAGMDHFMEKYHKALMHEIELFIAQQSGQEKIKLDTIFIGGGTPSTYPGHLLLELFQLIKKGFLLENNAEVTLEVNPGTVKEGCLALWKQAGITRLSIGVQSLKDGVLADMNRHQSRQDVYKLLQEAPIYFDNLSVDLILGLPGINNQEWQELIAEVVTWPIKHVSVYFLTVHEQTPLYHRVKKNDVDLRPDDEMVDQYYWTIATLEKAGFYQYELSNFAKTGYESRHNMVYWDRKPYKAFGLGACSFDGEQRLQNDKNIMKYIAKLERNEDVTIFCELLNAQQAYLEKIMLGLRRRQGVSLSSLLEGLTDDQQLQIQEKLLFLHENVLIERVGSRTDIHDDSMSVSKEVAVTAESWRLTPQGCSVENQVVMHLSLV